RRHTRSYGDWSSDVCSSDLTALGKPTVVVLLNGSALAVNWANDHAAAIVDAWYPGEEGGAALADVLFGDYNPAGRLPVTFYKSRSEERRVGKECRSRAWCDH